MTKPDSEKSQDESFLPLLVVPDSRGRIRNWLFWRYQPYWRDVVVLCSRATPGTYLEYLQEHSITLSSPGMKRKIYQQRWRNCDPPRYQTHTGRQRRLRQRRIPTSSAGSC